MQAAEARIAIQATFNERYPPSRVREHICHGRQIHLAGALHLVRRL